MEKQLETEKKVLSALYEEELAGERSVGEYTKKEMAVVAGVPIEKVHEVFRKARSYKKMHKFLRNLATTGKPLPESMSELQFRFRASRFQWTKT